MTHHAYVYEGSLSLLPELAADARERFGFTKSGDPDVYIREFEKFGIDESRWLANVGALKSVSGRALFILGISSITSEAQQALLKLFEEPQQGTIFVLLLPHGTLLPTLRSRILPYPSFVVSQGDALPQTRKFLTSSHTERSAYIADLLKEDEGAKERVRDFVNELEALCVKLNFTQKPEGRQGLADIAMARGYLGDRSPSLKMLLEHLALSLPQP